MRRILVAVATLFVFAASPAWAQESPAAQIEALRRMVEEALKQNEDLRKRVRELEEAVSKQPAPAKEPTKEAAPAAPSEPGKAVVQEAPKEPAKAVAQEAPAAAPSAPIGWWNKLQLGGALEVEASSIRGFSGKRRSELQLTTAEFDFEADVVDWAKGELSFQWDQGTDTVKLSEAFITLTLPQYPVYLKAGRGVVPFGISSGTTVAAKLSDTQTITGPLTSEIFEVLQDYGIVGVRKWGFHAGGYLFNGSTNNVPGGGKQLNHYGFTAGYEFKGDPVSFDVSGYWINSVFDATGLLDAYNQDSALRGRNYVQGVALVARLGLYGFSLILEYDTALQHKRFTRELVPDSGIFNTYNVKPEAWQVELGYTTDAFFNLKTFLAVNYSQSASMLGSFAKDRFLATIGAWLFHDNIRLAVEYGAETDYSKVQLGTGAHGESWIVKLTYEW
jgi:hypothetical protein